MTATITPLKPFHLFIVGVSFIAALAALAASLRPAHATDVTVPTAQAVPVAPAAHLSGQPHATPSAVAVVPQPAPVPAAPGMPVAEAQHLAVAAPNRSVTSSPLTLLALAVAAGLLAAGTLAQRQTRSDLRPAAC